MRGPSWLLPLLPLAAGLLSAGWKGDGGSLLLRDQAPPCRSLDAAAAVGHGLPPPAAGWEQQRSVLTARLRAVWCPWCLQVDLPG